MGRNEVSGVEGKEEKEIRDGERIKKEAEEEGENRKPRRKEVVGSLFLPRNSFHLVLLLLFRLCIQKLLWCGWETIWNGGN